MTIESNKKDQKSLLKVVVTGGGTVAPIDEIRWITNGSTGSFASGISESCLRAGGEVWHLATPSAQLPLIRSSRFDLECGDSAKEHARLEKLAESWSEVRRRLHIVRLKTGTVEEYGLQLAETVENNPIDVAFLAMAVSDFEPQSQPGKLDSDSEELIVRCKRAPKIIRFVRDWAPEIFLVGFKLLVGVSTDELIDKARRACEVNRANLTIANDLRSLQAGAHVVHLVQPDGRYETLGPCSNLAEQVVSHVFAMVRTRTTKS